ncbi:MAG: hypothetical protein CTY15_09660 [Methylocystis sp.]|nr:MAG: hypothetical protein CTY15_09660 [Methylocystis sp.]
MATHSSKAGKQSKSADAARDTSALPPEDTAFATTPPDAEAPSLTAVAVEAQDVEAAAEPVVLETVTPVAEVVQTSLAVVEQTFEKTTEAFSASFDFDASLWSKKSFQLWAENAAAFFDLAEKIARAQTFEEVVDLQSRFANDRFEAFVRQSKELMGLAQSAATLSAAPLCEVRKAA